MKDFLSLIILITLIPVSIFTMIYGWNIQPHNWGWISFGYTWMIVLPGIVGMMKD